MRTYTHIFVKTLIAKFLALIFILFTFPLVGQVITDGDLPESFVICGESQVVEVVLTGPYAGGTMEAVMPAGYYYVGTATGNSGCATEATDDPKNPIINFPSLTAGEGCTFSYEVRTDCELFRTIDDTQGGDPEYLFIINYILDNGAMGFSSPTIMHQYPTLNVDVIEDGNPASPGTPFLRKIRICQDGPDAYVADDIVLGNGIVGGLTLMSAYLDDGTVLNVDASNNITIPATDFDKTKTRSDVLSDGDFLFEGSNSSDPSSMAECLYIDMIMVVDCANMDLTHKVITNWGCDSEKCAIDNEVSISTNSLVGTPILTKGVKRQVNTCFNEGPTSDTLIITNTGNGSATEIELNLHAGSTYGVPRDDRRSYDSGSFVMIINDGTPMPITFTETIPYTGVGGSGLHSSWNLASCAGTNDGDIISASFTIPFIDVGDQVKIAYDVYTCCEPLTCTGFDTYYTLVRGLFQNACGEGDFVFTNYNINGRSYAYLDDTEEYPTDIFDNETAEIVYVNTRSSLSGFSSFTAFFTEIQFPCGLIWDGNLELFDSNLNPKTVKDLSYDPVSNILTFKQDNTNNWQRRRDRLEVGFMSDCSVDCSIANPATIGMTVDMVYDTTCIDQCRVNLLCNSNNLTIHCPGPCPWDNITPTEFSLYRVTLGQPDLDNDGLPDSEGTIDPADARTNRATLCDIIEGCVTANVSTTQSVPATDFFEYGYMDATIGPNGTSLTAIGGRLEWWDNSAGTWRVTTDIGWTQTGASVHWDFSPSTLCDNGYTNACGLTFGHDDIIKFYPQWEVTGNIGGTINVQTATMQIYGATEEDAPPNTTSVCADCDPIVYPDNRYTCTSLSGSFTLTGTFFTVSGYTELNRSNCDNFTLSQYSYFWEGGAYYGANFFENEYRDLATMDSCYMDIPLGYDINEFYILFRHTRNLSYHDQVINDLIPYRTSSNPDGSTRYYFDIKPLFVENGGTVIPSDEGWIEYFYANVTPTCAIPSGELLNNAFGTYNRYDYCETDVSFERERVPKVRFIQPQLTIQSDSRIKTMDCPEVCWPFRIANIGDVSRADNVWVYFPPGNILIDEVTLDGNALPENNGFFELGNINIATINNYEICGTSSVCEPDSVMLLMGYRCGGYPENIADLNCAPDTLFLVVDPKLPQFSVEVLQPITAITEVDLCEEIEYELLYKNIGQAKAFNLESYVYLPNDGVELIPGTVEIEYPCGSGYVDWVTTEPTPTSTFLGDLLIFDVTAESDAPDALISPLGVVADNGFVFPSISEVDNCYKIRFRLKPNCNLDASGDLLRTIVRGDGPCSLQGDTRGKVSSNLENIGTLKINGADPYVLQVSGNPVENHVACAGNLDLEFDITMASSATTGPLDSIRMSLPDGVTLINSSYGGVGFPVITTLGTDQQLVWPIDPPISTGESINLDLEIDVDPSKIECETLNLSIETTSNVEAECLDTPGMLCDITVNTGRIDIQLNVDKPLLEVEIKDIVAMCSSDPLLSTTVIFDITNNGPEIPAGSSFPVAIYSSNDGSCSLFGDITELTVIDIDGPISVGEIITFNENVSVPAESCFLIAEIKDCVCGDNPQESCLEIDLPLPDNGPFNTCHNEQIEISTCNNSLYNYTWTPILPASMADFYTSIDTGIVGIQPQNTTGTIQIFKYIVDVDRGIGCRERDTIEVTVRPDLTPGPISSDALEVCPTDNLTYSFSVEPQVTATSLNWTVPADATIVSGQGTENIIVNWGEITGDVCIDVDDGICPTGQLCVEVTTDPLLCCDLTIVSDVVVSCNNNDTPKDPTDDFITVALIADAVNPGVGEMYQVLYDGEVISEAPYGLQTTAGTALSPPFLTNGIDQYTLQIVDKNHQSDCMEEITIGPISECSDECSMEISSFVQNACFDNGTPQYPDDDYFSVTVNATNLNDAGSDYEVLVNNILVGSAGFGTAITVGTVIDPPFAADGVSEYTVVVRSKDFPDCFEEITTDPVDPCSEDCVINAMQFSQGPCNDNGTPSDESDDWYSIVINAGAVNGGPSGEFEVLVDNVVIATSPYITPISIGDATTPPFKADGITEYIVVIRDKEKTSCSKSLLTIPVASCAVNSSESCSVTIPNTQTNNCNDNGTPLDITDDFFTVTLSSSNVAPGMTNMYKVITGSEILGMGVYDGSITVGSNSPTPFLADGVSTYTIIIEDYDDPSCNTSIQVGPVNSCQQILTCAATVLSDVSCQGESTGSASVQVEGGATPYSYLWSDNSINPTLSNVGAGNYFVTITDAANDMVVCEVEIEEPMTLVCQMLKNSDVTCNGEDNGMATLNVIGGVLPYTYEWDNSESGFKAFNLSGGNHFVTVTDGNSCTVVCSVQILEPELLTCSVDDIEVSCFGDLGVLNVSALGGVMPYEYSFDGSPFQPGSSFGDLTAGAHIVSVRDFNGCYTSCSATITQPSELSCIITSTGEAACGMNNGSAEVIGIGGTGTYSFVWDNGQTSSSVSNLTGGEHYVTVTDSDNCVSICSVVILTTTGLMCHVDKNNDVSCNGESDGSAIASAIGGSAPYSYIWSTGATTALENALPSGSHSVTITDANSCISICSITITEPSILQCNIMNLANASCKGSCDGVGMVMVEGGTPNSAGTSQYNYAWDNESTKQMAENLCAGVHSVTVTDSNSCTTECVITITEPTGITCSLTPTHLSCNQSNDGAIEVSAFGGTMPYEYSVDGSPWQPGNTLESLNAGNHEVNIRDANGCIGMCDMTLTEPLILECSITKTNDATCGIDNGAAIVSIQGGTSPFTILWDNDETSLSVNNLNGGYHSVTVTDANNCETTCFVQIDLPTGLSCSINDFGHVSCFGSNDGFASVYVNGNTGPYSYSWSNMSTSTTISSLVAGNYSVTVTDIYLCETVCQIEILEPEILECVSFTENNVSCNGGSDGQATIMVYGGTTIENGTSPYLFEWDNGETTQTAHSLSEGNHNVTITDDNNCQSICNVTIVSPLLLQCEISSMNLNCFEDESGAISITPSGGTAPYRFSLNGSPLQNSNYFDELSSGTYTILVEDDNNCISSCSVDITQPEILTCTAEELSGETCDDTNGSAVVNVSGGTTPYTYQWDNGETTQTAIAMSAGVHSVTITDSKDCISECQVVIQTPDGLSCLVTKINDIVCFEDDNGQAQVAIEGGFPPFNILWSNGETNNIAIALLPGLNSVTITDNEGCITSCNVNIAEPELLSCSISKNSDVSCFGLLDGSASVEVNGGTPNYNSTTIYNFNWDNGETLQTAENLSAGLHVVTVTDDNGCSTTCEISILQPQELICSLEKEDLSCNGDLSGSITVSQSGGISPFEYSINGGAYQVGNYFGGLSAGLQEVQVRDAGQCITTCSTVIVEPSELTCSTIENSPATCGISNGVATVTVQGGSEGYSYQWDNGETAPTASMLSAGIHFVTVTDDEDCEEICEVIITTPNGLSCSINNILNITCFGNDDGKAIVYPEGGTAPYIYSWSNGEVTASAQALVPGINSVTVTDADGCITVCNIEIIEPEILTCTANKISDVTCYGESNGSAKVTVIGGVDNENATESYTYEWDNGETSQIANNLNAGIHEVTITDDNLCTTFCTVEILEPLELMCNLEAENLTCFDNFTGIITATAEGGEEPYEFSLNGSPWQPGNIFENLPDGNQKVDVRDANGCLSSCFILITQPTFLTCTVSQDYQAYCESDNGSATVEPSGGVEPYSYLWDNSEIGMTALALSPGYHEVTVTDVQGCQSVCDVTITAPAALSCTTNVLQDLDCFGDSDGLAIVQASGGTFPYTYAWDNGETNLVASNLTGGIHYVTITDFDGCQSICGLEILEPELLQCTTMYLSSISCNGQSDGSAMVLVDGGTPDVNANAPYSFLWDNGESKQTAEALDAGFHSVTVTDDNGCATTCEIEILEPPILECSIDVVHFNCDLDHPGGITINVFGGLAPYEYSINGEAWQPGKNYSNLEPGSYNIEVRDYNGCLTTCETEVIEVDCYFDLALRKVISPVTPGPICPGEKVSFVIEVFNQGTLDAYNVEVVDYFPAEFILDDINWYSFIPGHAQRINDINFIAVGESEAVTITFRVSDDFMGTELTNWAEIIKADDNNNPSDGYPEDEDSNYDQINFNQPGETDDLANDDVIDNSNGDEDDHDPALVTVKQEFDLALKKEFDRYDDNDGDEIISVGDDLIYTISIYNQGSLDANDIVVRDYVSTNMIFHSLDNPQWDVNNNSNSETTILSLSAGDMTSFEIELQVDPMFMGTEVINTAEIISSSNSLSLIDEDDDLQIVHGYKDDLSEISTDNDVDDEAELTSGLYDNPQDVDDYDLAVVPVGQVFDLALTKQVNYNLSPDTIYPGGLVTFDINVINQGSLAAYDIQIADYIPAELTLEDPNWNEVFGVAYLNTAIPSLGVGQSTTVSIQFRIDYDYRGETEIINYAEISQADDDNDSTNTYPTDVDSNPDGINGNETIGGDNMINNENGDEDDHDPELLVVDLTYDFAQHKTEASNGQYKYGDFVEFTFTLTNQGGLPGSEILVADYVPCGFDFNESVNPNWSFDTETRIATYIYSQVIDVHQNAEFNLILQLRDCKESNAWLNVSEIVEGYDPVTGNLGIDNDSKGDMIADNDVVGTDNEIWLTPSLGDEDDHDIELIDVFDLALRKSIDDDGPYEPGDVVRFDIWLFNQGNIDAHNISIIDYLTEGFLFDQSLNSKWSIVGSNLESSIQGSLDAGDSLFVTLDLEISIPSGATKETWYNYSEIISATNSNGIIQIDADSQGDISNSNDNDLVANTENDGVICESNGLYGSSGDDEDDHDVEDVIVGYDLALRQLNLSNGPYSYGDEVTFEIQIFNQGGSAVSDIEITEYLPCGYRFESSLNPNWIYDSEDHRAKIIIDPVLYTSDFTSVELILLVQSCDVGSADNYLNFAEISEFMDEYGDPRTYHDIDSTPDNNNTNDGNWNNDQINDPDDEDDHDGDNIEICDLALIKTVADIGPYDVGEIVTFTIEVFNQGNVPLKDIEIADYLNSGYIFNSELNPGWFTENGMAKIILNNQLLPGHHTSVQINLEIQVPANADIHDWYNEAEISEMRLVSGELAFDSDSQSDDNPDNDNDLVDGNDDDIIFNGDNNDNEINESADDPFENGDDDEDDNDGAEILVVGGLGDTVWKDIDGDGIQDEDEPGVEDVIVTLTDCGGNLIQTDTTDTDGFYFFNNLIPGDYQVQFDISQLPIDCAFTQQDLDNNDTIDSDVDLNGFAPCTNIQGGEYDSTIDAGLLILVDIGDFVWHDLDGDGVQDVGEPGIEDVYVYLFDEGNNLIEMTMTDADGYYLFENIYPDTYFIAFGDPDGFEVTFPNKTADDMDSDITNFILSPYGSTTDLFTIVYGQEGDLTFDAGYYMCVPIGELVWYDLDEDDIHDSAENGINGLEVNLYRFDNGGYELYETQLTGHKPNTASEDGYYKFCAPPGTYYIEVKMPPLGLVLAVPNKLNSLPLTNVNESILDSDMTNDFGNSTTTSFKVLSGESIYSIGTGFYPMATLGNRVWFDDNENGIQDDGEQAVVNVKVQAISAVSGQVIKETYTDANGIYKLDYLRKEAYYIKVEQPNGYGFTQSNVGDDDKDNDIDHSNGANTTKTYSLKPGDENTSVDAGIAFGVLPLTWIDVRAERLGRINEVSWITADEIDASHFIVERAHNQNLIFAEVGRVEANNKLGENKYSLIDYESNGSGIYYYRIKQVDIDRRNGYSKIVYVSVENDLNRMSVSPNPAVENARLSIDLATGAEADITVFDRTGKLVRSYKLDYANEGYSKTIEISDLPSGVYTIRLIQGELEMNNKLIIVK